MPLQNQMCKGILIIKYLTAAVGFSNKPISCAVSTAVYKYLCCFGTAQNRNFPYPVFGTQNNFFINTDAAGLYLRRIACQELAFSKSSINLISLSTPSSGIAL